MLLPLLAERGVVIEIVPPRAGLLRTAMRPETFHRLMHILASNSLDWLGGVGSDDPNHRLCRGGALRGVLL